MKYETGIDCVSFRNMGTLPLPFLVSDWMMDLSNLIGGLNSFQRSSQVEVSFRIKDRAHWSDIAVSVESSDVTRKLFH